MPPAEILAPWARLSLFEMHVQTGTAGVSGEQR